MKVFLDDCRQTPENWQRTFTVEETVELLKTGLVSELSLDNDLGDGLLEGFKVLDWLEEQYFNGRFDLIPEKIYVHSANFVARQRMTQIIERILQK